MAGARKRRPDLGTEDSSSYISRTADCWLLPADAELVHSLIAPSSAVTESAGPRLQGGQGGQENCSCVNLELTVVTPRSKHNITIGLKMFHHLNCHAFNFDFLTWICTCPDWLRTSTPAGARRLILAVVLSKLKECPAGDRTALVARDSLRKQSSIEELEVLGVLLDTEASVWWQDHSVRSNECLPSTAGEQGSLVGVCQLKLLSCQLDARLICIMKRPV